MRLTYLGTESGDNGCPTLYATDHNTFVIQGWKLLDGEALSQMDIPSHETAIEIPAALLRFAPCNHA